MDADALTYDSFPLPLLNNYWYNCMNIMNDSNHIDPFLFSKVKILSQKRADSIRNALISRGVMAFRLQSIGFGIERPIADNNTENGRQMNRRVEFHIIHQ